MQSASRLLQLISFEHAGAARLGALLGSSRVVDLNACDATLPRDMRSLLEAGPTALHAVRRIVQGARDLVTLPFDAIRVLAPIRNPEKIICIGLNYVDHAQESNVPLPTEPVMFSKFASAIINPGDNIVLPRISKQVDYEAELVVVIGTAGRNIPEDSAMRHVAGFTVGHDVSARDWQLGRPGG